MSQQSPLICKTITYYNYFLKYISSGKYWHICSLHVAPKTVFLLCRAGQRLHLFYETVPADTDDCDLVFLSKPPLACFFLKTAELFSSLKTPVGLHFFIFSHPEHPSSFDIVVQNFLSLLFNSNSIKVSNLYCTPASSCCSAPQQFQLTQLATSDTMMSTVICVYPGPATGPRVGAWSAEGIRKDATISTVQALGEDERSINEFSKYGTQQLSKSWYKLDLFLSFIGKIFTKDIYDDLWQVNLVINMAFRKESCQYLQAL